MLGRNNKLVAECIPSERIDQIIENLSNGKIMIENEEIVCNVDLDLEKILTNKFWKHFTEDEQYDYWVASIPYSSHNTEYMANEFGFADIDSDLQFPDISQWFEISDDNWKGIALQILFLLPIEIKKERISCGIDKSMSFKYLINSDLNKKTRTLIKLLDSNGKSQIPLPNAIKILTKLMVDVTSEMDISIQNLKVDEITGYDIKFKHLDIKEPIFSDVLNFDEKVDTVSLTRSIHSLDNDLWEIDQEITHISLVEQDRELNTLYTKLKTLSENEFIKLLDELLTKMNFKNVKRNESHGAQEKGLDIPLFSDEDKFKKKIYYGVQAKSMKIHLNSRRKSGNAVEIFRQLEAAFAADFLDTVDGRSKRVDKIILANTNEITEEANKYLIEKFRGRITILDGRDVATLIIENDIHLI
jgi:hypothetical protein